MGDEAETGNVGTNGKDEELYEPIKDRHTWVDEVANNIIKVALCLFIMACFWHCLVNYVGKDKGVDPNVIVNVLATSLSSLLNSDSTDA